jgi:hypothetical protein
VTGGITDPSCWWHFAPTSLVLERFRPSGR